MEGWIEAIATEIIFPSAVIDARALNSLEYTSTCIACPIIDEAGTVSPFIIERNRRPNQAEISKFNNRT